MANIDRWARELDWTDSDYCSPPEVMHRLQQVRRHLEPGVVYKLRNPGPDAEHAYGGVVGLTGFHEFVVIDRCAGIARVLVASDD